MSVNVAQLRALVGADDQEFQTVMQRSERTLIQTGRRASEIGRQLSVTLTAPLVAAGTASAKLSINFQRTMAEIQGLTGTSAEQVEVIRQGVLGMVREIGKSPQELAEAAYFISSSGLKGAAALEALRASAKAAAAGLGETKDIANAVTSVIGAYGQKNITAAQTTDILVAAVREGKAEASEFAGSVGRVIPIASQMGVSFDKVAAAMASMTLIGLSADESATALRGTLAGLLRPTQQTEKALQRLGLSAAGVRQELKENLIGALVHLAEAAKGDDQVIGELFGNVRALTGVLSLTGANAETVARIFYELENSAGLTNEAFQIMEDTAGHKLTRAFSSLQAAGIEFGDAMAPSIEKVAAAIERLANGAQRVPGPIKTMMLASAGLLAVVGPLTYGLGQAINLLRMFGLTTVAVSALQILTSRAYLANDAVRLLVFTLRTQGVAGLTQFAAGCGGASRALAALTGMTGMFTGALKVLSVSAIPAVLAGVAVLTVQLWRNTAAWDGVRRSATDARNAVEAYASSLAGMKRAELVALQRQHEQEIKEIQAQKERIRGQLKSALEPAPFVPMQTVGLQQGPIFAAMKRLNEEGTQAQEKLKGVLRALKTIDEQDRAMADASKAMAGAGGAGLGIGGAEARVRELTDQQMATESLNSAIRDMYRQHHLGEVQIRTGEQATLAQAMAWDVLNGQYRDADANVAAWAISQASALDTQNAAIRAAAEQAALTKAGEDRLAALNRELFLGGSASRTLSVAYDLCYGSLKDLDEEVKKSIFWTTQRIEQGERDRETTEKQQRAAEAFANRLAEITSGSRRSFLDALVGTTDDIGLRVFMERFTDTVKPEVLATIDTVDDLRRVIEGLPPELAKAYEESVRFAQGEQALRQGAEEAREALERQQTATEMLNSLLGEQTADIARLNGKWTTAEELLRSLNIAAADLSEDGLAKLNQAVDNATAIERLTRVQEFIGNMRDMFTDAFESLFTEGFGSFFDNVIAGFDRLLQQMAAKWLANETMNLIMGSFGLNPGGVFGSMIQGRAAGGSVYGGQPYLVGEAGPELFVPQTTGRILPNSQLAMAGASVGTVIENIAINIHVQTPDVQGFRRSQAQLMDEVGRQIESVIRRNG